jgi:hypothetical protein
MAQCFWDLVKDDKSAPVSAALLCVSLKHKYESKVCLPLEKVPKAQWKAVAAGEAG